MSDKVELKVWWVPQMPMKAFEVRVESVGEGVFTMNTLAQYDQFQLDNNIKPDYCNAGGLLMLVGEEWEDWFDSETGEDCPVEHLRYLRSR